jgi:diacylglycerol kinase family enzyme
VKAQILINRGGGSVGDRRAIEQALDSAGIAGDIQVLEGKQIRAAADSAVAAGAELIVAGGGDGTMSCVAGAVAGTAVRMGILPLGTLNHFARDLDIPADVGEAAEAIAAGKVRRVDVAEVNGRVFVNNSAIGVYPRLVSEREAEQQRLGKRLAMAVASVRTLLRFSSRRLTLAVDGREAQVVTPLLFVGNNDYRLELPDPGTRERLDAGELCVIVLRRKSRLGFAIAAVRALFGRARCADVVALDDVRELIVDSSRPALRIALDGETALMETPLTYRIRAGALQVIVP